MCYLLSHSIALKKAYLDARYKEEDFPVTNQLVKEVISLPMHTELDDEQIKFITDSVLVLNKVLI
jgi:dTDP-4-amino-4,6-dideoxygalactose transaminase